MGKGGGGGEEGRGERRVGEVERRDRRIVRVGKVVESSLTIAISSLPPKLLNHPLCLSVLLLPYQRPEGIQVATACVGQLGDGESGKTRLEVHGGHLAVLDVALFPVTATQGHGGTGQGRTSNHHQSHTRPGCPACHNLRVLASDHLLAVHTPLHRSKAIVDQLCCMRMQSANCDRPTWSGARSATLL